jgi:hypothetical protein
VPGTGQPDWTKWPEVYRRIRAAGKLVQVWGGQAELDGIADALGSAEGIIIFGGAKLTPENGKAAEKFLMKYGAL